MQTAGIIIEYNPMHSGHLRLVRETRASLDTDCAVIGVMSGNFVQRGDFALLRKQARARAAVESGMDLVLELPLPWAVSSAERFADGGVRTLMATGVVTHLAFGSECGDADALMEVAACLNSEVYHAGVRRFLSEGMSFAACRQAVVSGLLGPEKAALLEGANNNLGVEYCKALLRSGGGIQSFTICREGTPHDGVLEENTHPSASAIRGLLKEGRRDEALALLPPAMAAAYRTEEKAGRAPVFGEVCERAILARLRTMTEADFAALDEGREGLYHRMYDASRTAATLAELLEAAKTRRYAYARLRRMALWSYLGLTAGDFPREVPYLRPLAANETGCRLLARMRQSAAVPILTKPNHVRKLDESARRLFALEARATDLYTLAYPDLTAAAGGMEWREGPVIL